VSYQAVSWALYQAPMLRTAKEGAVKEGRDSTARMVLVVLAEHADPAGKESRPSVLRIRYATGLDERTIQRAMGRLEEAKLISRDGTTRDGVVRWTLAMERERPEDEWTAMVADADRVREVESQRRRERRQRKKSADVSGILRPGHGAVDNQPVSPVDNDGDSGVRDAESRMSGTQSTGVRDAESRMSGTQCPPNHPEEPPTTTTQGTTPGGTLPPDPLRPPAPEAPGTESKNSTSDQQDQPPPQPETASYDRAREDRRPASAEPAPSPNGRGKGLGFCVACHANGQIVLAVDPATGDICATHLRQHAT
jgi:hypothetical protein